jgi:hypothetical protein
MIISHVKIIAFQLSLFCKKLSLFKDCPLYNKQKNIWVLGNTRFISRVEHDISTLEINLHFRAPMYYSLFNNIHDKNYAVTPKNS